VTETSGEDREWMHHKPSRWPMPDVTYLALLGLQAPTSQGLLTNRERTSDPEG
jgi:hypothetical protein